MAIQHRRGAYSNFDKTKMLPAEIAVVQSGDPSSSDGDAIYIGTASGRVKQLATKEDMETDIHNALYEELPAATEAATQEAEGYAERAEAAAESLTIDNTLTQQGKAADAKAVGDALSKIVPGLSNAAKTALLNCFAHVAWIDDDGQDYYDALESALHGELQSVSAVFTQGGVAIYPATSLDDLKAYLVVTGYYADTTTCVITDYSLSGTLTIGTSTITVTYKDKTDTFSVNVTVAPIYGIAEGTDLSGQFFDTGVSAFAPDDDFTILASIEVAAISNPATNASHMLLTNGTIGGQNVLRLSFDVKNGIEYYVTNYIYGDSYHDVYTPGTIYTNTSHNVIWVMRNENSQFRKVLYIDDVKKVDKSENLTTLTYGTFSGNYSIGGSSGTTIDAEVNVFGIYDTALSLSEINNILGIALAD